MATKSAVFFLAISTVKFNENCRTDNKYFTLAGARFSGKSILPVFTEQEKHKCAKIEKNKFLVLMLLLLCLNSYPARFDVI